MNSFVAFISLALLASAFGATVQRPRPSRRTFREEAVKSEVCYDVYGCFSSDAPWTSLIRPLVSLPKAPHEVQTRFLLFTRNGDSEGYELMPNKEPVLFFSDFKASRKTFFLIHGFTNSHKTDWMVNAKNNLLLKGDYNVISVDWAPGAKSNYLRAVGNTRLVGSQGAELIRFLENKGNMTIGDVHIIGHSLGAQVAAYMGDRLMNRVAHITALDPAEPYFGGADKMVRLDSEDGVYVDVIHSNGNGNLNFGLGMTESIGHADFFPNGGKVQPGCKDMLGTIVATLIAFITFDFEGAIDPWACSHYRAGAFFAESITNTCPFVAHSCSNYNDFQSGSCYSTCTQEGSCHSLGFGSRNFKTARGNYYLHTAEGQDSKYCLQTERVDAPVALSQSTTTGTVTIAFRRNDGTKSAAFKIVDGRITAGQLLNAWVEVPSNIVSTPSERSTLVVRYTRSSIFQSSTLVLDSINLNVIDENLQVTPLRYSGVTLDTGVDVQVSS